MGHRVKIAPGFNRITLPNGEQYDAGEEVVLTDDEFERLSPSALGDEVLDLGEEAAPGEGGGGGAGLPDPPENQQGILIGATISDSPVTVWYAAERGQLLVGHESAGWIWLNPGDPGTTLTMNEEGDAEWASPATGAVQGDNRWYYYIDPTDYGTIANGDPLLQDWTYLEGTSYPDATDPNGRTQDGWIQVAQAGWYAIHAAVTSYFNGAGVMQFSLRVAGFEFSRQRLWKPSGVDGIDNQLAASGFALVYVNADDSVQADATVSLPSGTWGISDARLILHRVA